MMAMPHNHECGNLPVDWSTGTPQLSLGTVSSSEKPDAPNNRYCPPNRQTVPGSSGPTSKLNTWSSIKSNKPALKRSSPLSSSSYKHKRQHLNKNSSNLVDPQTHTSCVVFLWRQTLLKRTVEMSLMTGFFIGLVHLIGIVMLVSLRSSEGMDSGQDTISLRGTAAV